jgi:hypothetical protein
MAETIEESITNGFISWRNNLETGIPYFLSTVITAVLLIVSILGVAVVAAATAALTRDMESSLASALIVTAVCISSLAALALTAALNAYLSAGAIGMSLEASLKGRTTLSDMADYGRRRWFDVFKANILWAGLLVIPGIVLLLPPVYAFYMKAIPQGIAITIIAAAVYLTYAVIFCFMYNITLTAMILDGTGVMQGMRSAYAFFSKNKVKILFIFFAFNAAMYAASLAWAVVTSPLGLLQLLSPGIYQIAQGLLTIIFLIVASSMISSLYTIWLTRIYLGKGAKGAKTLHKPVSRQANREQPSTRREIYV